MAKRQMPPRAQAAPTTAPLGKSVEATLVPFNMLVRWSNNPRRTMDLAKRDMIAESIATRGQDTNVKARPIQPAGYEVYIGNTRLSAFGELIRRGAVDRHGCPYTDTYPVAVEINDVDDREAHEAAMAENIAKADMDDVDVAEGVLRMAEDHVGERDIARRLGLSTDAVHNAIAVARLDDRAKSLLRSKERPYGWGVALTGASAALRNRILTDVTDRRDDWPTVDTIRSAIRMNRVPAENAIFDLAAANVAVVPDMFEPETLWVVDVETFRVHQMAAIEARMRDLQAEGHVEVTLLRDKVLDHYSYRRDPDSPVRRAFVELTREGKVTVHDNLVPRSADAAADDGADAFGDEGDAPVAGVAREPAPELRAPSITFARPSRGKALAAMAVAKVAAGVELVRSDRTFALRALAAALLNRTELTYGEGGHTDDMVVARDEARAAAGLPTSRVVEVEDLPADVDALVDLLQGIAAGVLSAVPSRKAPFPEGGETIVGRALMAPGAMRRHWTPDAAFFEAMTLEELRGVAGDVLDEEGLTLTAMTPRQLVTTLASAFRDAPTGNHDLRPGTVAKLLRWVPLYVGTPTDDEEGVATGTDEGDRDGFFDE